MSALRISVPGRPVEFVLLDTDPERDLSDRQKVVLAAVRARLGNRSRAARDLKVSVQTVQQTLLRIGDHHPDVRIPVGRTGWPKGRPAKRREPGPRCGRLMQHRRNGQLNFCGLRAGHRGPRCRGEGSVAYIRDSQRVVA